MLFSYSAGTQALSIIVLINLAIGAAKTKGPSSGSSKICATWNGTVTMSAKNKFGSTVNSRYTGHPWHRILVSVIARVRNSGVRENFYFKPYLQEGVTCVFIIINSGNFFRPVVARKEHQNFFYKQNRT